MLAWAAVPRRPLQSLINTNIQKARFDLYSVYNDGSGGVHNPFYALTLLDTANAWVQGQMVPAPGASPSPSTTPLDPPLTLQQLESAAEAWIQGALNKPSQ